MGARSVLLALGLLVLGTAAPSPVAGASSVPAAHGLAGPARDKHTRLGSRALAGGGTTFMSRNWDGYTSYAKSAGQTEFNSVHGTWVQPAVTCTRPNAWTVLWVGLDGWFDDTVEQGGSSAQCVNGVPQYTTWWEMFPTNAIQTVFTVRPGDTIDATVTFSTTTQVFTIAVRDVTTGQSFTRTPT